MYGEYPDHVAAATAGRRCATAPETRRSTWLEVKVHAGRSRPRENAPASLDPGAWEYLGTEYAVRLKSQSSQVNSSASGRDNIGPDLLQGYDVTGLSGADRR